MASKRIVASKIQKEKEALEKYLVDEIDMRLDSTNKALIGKGIVSEKEFI